MENELKEAQTMNDIFKVCSKYYNLDVKLGVGTKSLVLMGIKKVIVLINAQPKK
jgi:phosphosulfolactate synthase (CoM biosynthesis protein A)